MNIAFFYRTGLHANWAICNTLLLCLVLALSGCAGPEIKSGAISTIVMQPTDDAKNSISDPFMFIGRLSVNAKHQKFSGGVRWRHTDLDDEIYLYSPLGQVVTEIYRNQSGVRLVTSEPAAYQAQSVENLTETVLGWQLPLAGLQFWVRGVHFPGSVAEIDMNARQQIVAIRQDGWRINYLKYHSNSEVDATLPKLIEFNRTDVKMKLVIDQWQRTAPAGTGSVISQP